MNRRKLIEAKNMAFHRLAKADLHIRRREHSALKDEADPVPWSWWEKRAGLDAVYREVQAALRQLRDHVAEMERQGEVADGGH